MFWVQFTAGRKYKVWPILSLFSTKTVQVLGQSHWNQVIMNKDQLKLLIGPFLKAKASVASFA